MVIAIAGSGSAGADGRSDSPPEQRVQFAGTADCGPAATSQERWAADQSHDTSWLLDGAIEEDLRAVGDHLNADTRPDGIIPLRKEFLGVTVDHSRRQVVVVLNPGMQVDTDRVAAELEQLTSAIGIRLVSGCRPMDQLQAILDEITSPEFLRTYLTRGQAFSAAIDPLSGTVHVQIGQDDRALGEEIQRRYGDAVTVERDPDGNGPIRLVGSRSNDISPH